MQGRRFARRGAWLALFLVPLAFVSNMLAVAVHEILGHGLAALCLGGEFSGFEMHWDGLGFASAWPAPGSPPWQECTVLLAGGVASVLAGVALLVIATRIRRPAWRLALLALASGCMLDSPTYTFWSALHPATMGDAARIVAITHSRGVQAVLVLAGSLLTLVGTVLPAVLLLREVQPQLSTEDPLPSGQRLVLVLVFFLVPNLAFYYVFDWNQIIEGIGMLPSHVNAVLAMLLTVGFWGWFGRQGRGRAPADSASVSSTAMAISWTVGVCALLFVEGLLARGVRW